MTHAWKKSPYSKKQKVGKAKCINHVAKHLGTGFCGIKNIKGKAQGGKWKLQEVVIDHLQFYFQVS